MLPRPDLSLFDRGDESIERCGVIVQSGDTFEVVEMPNRAELQGQHFAIWNSDIHSFLPPDTQIVGVVHTHPSRFPSVPSDDDIHAIPSGLVGMVYHPSTTSIAWYDENGIIKHIKKRKRR